MELEVANDVLDVVYDVFGGKYHKHQRTKHQISFNCPVCDDNKNKGNLEINYSKLLMKCWSCGENEDGLKGSLRKLIKLYGSKKDLKLYDEVTEGYVPVFDKGKFKENYKPDLKLPKEYIRMATAKRNREFLEAYNYLKGRGINDELIDKYDIGFCHDGKYGGRIIIPSYDKDGDLNYFVARSYTGSLLKYNNPEVAKTDIIVNQLAINWDSTIYIVEGMFDLVGLGIHNCVPLLGKVLPDKLYYELLKKAKGYVVICLDPDATKDAYRIYQRLQHSLELHDKVRVIDLPMNKDIAKIREDYGERGVLKCIKKARKLKLNDFIKYNL